MNSLDQITSFLGWCALINIGLLLLSWLLIMALRQTTSGLHAKMFALDEQSVRQAYFEYLGHYKILIWVFNIVPYFALKIIG